MEIDGAPLQNKQLGTRHQPIPGLPANKNGISFKHKVKIQ
jgi:hypothetical protein